MQLGALARRTWPLAAATGVMAVAAALTSITDGGAAPGELGGLGVQAYPGATPIGGRITRVRSAEATTVRAAYETPDPVDSVAAFYRVALRTTSASQQLFDDTSRSGFSLMLSHGPRQRSVIVDIDRTASGTSILIRSNQPASLAVPRCIARSSVCARPAASSEAALQRRSSSSG